jgi:nucleotide-binding universal stress UspA family protein
MYKRILVPLDGSELAEHVLEHVKVIAKGSQSCQVILLQVIEPLLISFKTNITQANRYREEEDEFEKSVQDYLSGAAKSLKKSGISARTAIARLTHGSASGEILNFAKENDVDLIIMSTHGKTGSSRWRFGSVASRVTAHSPVPVLVVAPSGFRND